MNCSHSRHNFYYVNLYYTATGCSTIPKYLETRESMLEPLQNILNPNINYLFVTVIGKLMKKRNIGEILLTVSKPSY